MGALCLQEFVLDQVPVPEASVFALFGLGIAALLIFRRCQGSRGKTRYASEQAAKELIMVLFGVPAFVRHAHGQRP
jgi:hypothetical protein